MTLEFLAMLLLIVGWLACFWIARELRAGEIHHVNVENESRRIPSSGGKPCVFILEHVEINREKAPGVPRQFGPITVILSADGRTAGY